MLRNCLSDGSCEAFAFSAHAEDVKEVQMLHWWTSGGETAALTSSRATWPRKAMPGKDVPVAGGGGDAAI